MEIIIEKANRHDHSEIMNLLEEWFEESPLKFIPRGCPYSTIWLSDLIVNHLVIVGRKAGKIIGALGLRVTYFPWNNEVLILTDDFFMTKKEERSTGISDLLIDEAKRWANIRKMILNMGHFSGKDAELKDRYIERHGFTYTGANLIFKGE